MILGVDTAGRRGGVALLAPDGAVWARDLGEQGRHAEALIPAVLELLEDADLGWEEIRLAAVNVGPGSFTGIRVGVAAVLGLALSRNLKGAGVGCIDIHARACYDAMSHPTGGYIVSAADVRRGEAVVGRFRAEAAGPRREGDDRLVSVEDPGAVPPEGTTVTGDAAGLLWPQAPGLSRWVAGGRERAVAAARLGEAALLAGEVEPPVPRYARPADARPRRR